MARRRIAQLILEAMPTAKVTRLLLNGFNPYASMRTRVYAPLKGRAKRYKKVRKAHAETK